MAVLTFSRQLGSGGREIALDVARRLGAAYLDREIVNAAAELIGVPAEQLANIDERSVGIGERFAHAVVSAFSLAEPHSRAGTGSPIREHAREVSDVSLLLATRTVIRRLADEGCVVIVGRGGQAILADQPGVVHVRVMAPVAIRATRLAEARGISYQAALELIEEADRQGDGYLRRFYHIDWNDPANYNLVVNTGRVVHEDAVNLIVAAGSAVDKRELASVLASLEPYSDRGALRAAIADLRQALAAEVGSYRWREAIRTAIVHLRSDAACTSIAGAEERAECCAVALRAADRLARLRRDLPEIPTRESSAA